MTPAPSETTYLLGGSSAELERIDGIHESTVNYMGKLLLAPIDFQSRRLRILDSGTAGGRWLRELRKLQGSNHEYVGTDITTSFLTSDLPDDNIIYRAWDITKQWPQELLPGFDVVHQRFVLGAIRKAELHRTVSNLTHLVRPGGWIELLESDVRQEVVTDDSNEAAPVWRLLRDVYLAMQVEPDPDQYLRGWLEEAGFVDISEVRVPVPVGPRRLDAEMGTKSARTVVVTAQHLVMGAKQLGPEGTSFSPQALDALPREVGAALGKRGGTYSVYAIYGRRPSI
ncbi:hypothetical protein N0V93_004601 [Gnomoniopsis smithogilvyi]|uniref:Methyltransferase n=1 Tax=Gnomoniopsis smithogilvyi TaxID=1191159 RepID=A0A9W8YV06_9PEZI|nr:hypothetical protein N0V93_004601 [Gnomoniopsis smithogilvyi]